MSWNRKNTEILLEMEQHKIDICAVSETKRKGKGSIKVPGYVFLYSGVSHRSRATAGVGILLSDRYEQSIEEVHYINERLLRVALNTETGRLHLFSVYAPDISKPREETAQFYETLEEEISKIPQNERILIMGDLNARIGNNVIQGVKHHFNEEHLNENGEALVDLCARHNIRINNTFFRHRSQHKITWQNSRGQSSTIDYILSNRAIHPNQILDVRSLTSANIGSDHFLVLCKLRIYIQKKKLYVSPEKEKWNIESLNDPSTRDLYQTRLYQKIESNSILEEDDVENSWNKIQLNVLTAANEAIGKRIVNTNKHNQTKQWFTPEIKELAKRKRNAYLRYRSNRTPEERQHYTQIRNRVNTEIRNIKREYWERFSSEMEHDLYGAQKKIWGMLRRRKLDLNEYAQTQKIDEDTWKNYFRNLYNSDQDTPPVDDEGNHDIVEVTAEMTAESARKLKNRKAPGLDDIPNEFIKYGEVGLLEELTRLYNKILTTGKIPSSWKKSITIPIFKRGDKRVPENYRGITLLSSVMKLFTKILETIIYRYINISEEQQGFRRNRSTLDSIFILRQITEKSIEYGKPAFLCFIDLTKAFDNVRLKDVMKILKDKQLPTPILKIVKQLNTDTSTHISVNQHLTEEIRTPTGIRQGDSLSPLLFNIIMDQIIHRVKSCGMGYRLSTGAIKIVCYADDAVILAECEDDLQRLLYSFFLEACNFNMQISITKTKSMVISKEPKRCKLVIADQPIEQVMSFSYLGVEISSNQDRTHEVRKQADKACRVAGALRDVIFNNKHMSKHSKARIYKTCVRPIMTYGIETRADNKRTKSILRTTEMKILRTISGYTLRDRKRNTAIREECQTQDIAKWGRKRRRYWNDHVSRMDAGRIARIARDGIPGTRRPVGRPPKRWKDSWISTSTED